MTFAEIVVLILLAALIYRLMTPLRRWIELKLYIFFRSKMPPQDKPIIDITDYKDSKGPKK